MAPHFSTLAWKIPWTEEPGGLQSMGSLRVGHDRATSLSLFTFMHWKRKWQPTPLFLPGESQGQRGLVGCRLWGCTESDTTEVTQQQQHSSGLISFRIDQFDLLIVQGTLKSLQHHSSKASVSWHSVFFMVQLSHPYMTSGKTIAELCQKAISEYKYVCINESLWCTPEINTWLTTLRYKILKI